MKVKTNLLREGQILASDVFSMTNQPIINKDTVLTQTHLRVLRHFLIEEADVLPDGVWKSNEEPRTSELKKERDVTVEASFKQNEPLPFAALYLQTVKKYKQMFSNWQSGASVNMLEVRQTMLDLIESGMNHPRQILHLHHHSNATDYLYHHAVSVGVLSAFLGSKLNFPKGDCLQLGLAGALCDAGMAKVQPHLLHKKGSLNPTEFEEVKQHTVHGYQLLKKIPSIKEGVLLGVLQHHEREDGSGYPLKVQGNKLHFYSKVLAVADVYVAMTAERPYRSKQSPFRVLEQMTKDQFGKFDHQVLQALLSGLSIFSVGSRVKLNSFETGEIIFMEDGYPTRPMVKLEHGEIITLKNRTDLYIEELLS